MNKISSNSYSVSSYANNSVVHNNASNSVSNNTIEISIEIESIPIDIIEQTNEEKNQQSQSENTEFHVVNLSDLNKKNGWELHLDDDTTKVYYYYENGIRIKKMELRNDKTWKETDLTKKDVYEIGQSFKNMYRYGYYRKFENGILLEENKYYKDELVGIHRVFNGKNMSEYDLNGDLLYCGQYSMRKGIFSRDGLGKEYLNNELIYDGKWYDNERYGLGKEYENGEVYIDVYWKHNIPDGHGKVYLENGTVCLEGSWEKGYLKYEDECYSYFKHDFICGITYINWLWSEVICALIIIYGGSLLSLGCEDRKDFMVNINIIGIAIFTLCYIHQYQDKILIGFSIFFYVIYFIMSIVILFLGIANVNHIVGSNPFLLVIYNLLYVLMMYINIANIVITIKKRKAAITTDIFKYLSTKHGYGCIYLDSIVGFIFLIRLCTYATEYDLSETDIAIIICDIITSVVSFICAYCLSQYEIVLMGGVWLGIGWIVVSLILIFVLDYFYCISLVVSLSSIFMYLIRRNSNTLIKSDRFSSL